MLSTLQLLPMLSTDPKLPTLSRDAALATLRTLATERIESNEFELKRLFFMRTAPFRSVPCKRAAYSLRRAVRGAIVVARCAGM